jgi:biotin carboxyl carrier protein
MNKVTVNDKFQFDVAVNDGVLAVNDKAVAIDLLNINGQLRHVLYQNKSYNIEVAEFDKEAKQAKIKVNGNIYQVQVTTQLDLLLKQLGMDNLSASKVQQIKAPMPGLVLNVMVKAGDEVKKGDNLLVLEAMKMENIIKSPTDAVVKKVEVAQGDKIEKNAVLVQFG